MTIVNGRSLVEAGPIEHMLETKERSHGVSFGLAEAGYDIRIKQDIHFHPQDWNNGRIVVSEQGTKGRFNKTSQAEYAGRFTIASAIERFHMPDDLVGVVHDKSTWARRGLSVFNTVIEPGWEGFLTLELVYHGQEYLHVPAGAGIAQVLFSRIENTAAYNGKYQNQEDRPVHAIHEE